MHEAYAQALWKMIEAGMQPKKAVHSLYDILVARGRSDLMPHIGKAFARLAQRHQMRDGIILTVARERDQRTAITQVKTLLKEMDVASDTVGTNVDETLIGGWRLEGRERLVDASFKKQLLSLYNQATQ